MGFGCFGGQSHAGQDFLYGVLGLVKAYEAQLAFAARTRWRRRDARARSTEFRA
jgi:hypothetical protein